MSITEQEKGGSISARTDKGKFDGGFFVIDGILYVAGIFVSFSEGLMKFFFARGDAARELLELSRDQSRNSNTD